MRICLNSQATVDDVSLRVPPKQVIFNLHLNVSISEPALGVLE